MPRIVKSYGVQVTDEVFRITDTAPAAPAPRPRHITEDDGVVMISEMMPEFTPDMPDAPGPGQEPPEPVAEPEPEPEDSFEQLPHQMQSEIIQGAMAEAGRILEEAVKNAESAKENILTTARQEAARLQKDAAENGRREGFASVIGEVREGVSKLEAAVARLEGEQAAFEAEYEEQLKWFAMEIAAKVLAKKVSQDDSLLLEMVMKTMRGVAAEPWIRVEVAEEMTRLLEALKHTFAGEDKIEVLAVPASPGTIHIETPSGVIDASLRTQLENLKDYFEQAMPNQTGA